MILLFLSFVAGIALATQASLNAHLGQLLSNSLLATFVAFTSSAFFTIMGVLFYMREFPSMQTVKAVPTYLWFTGGILSAFALATFYYLIPKIGILPLITFSLGGQLLFSVLAGHFGWFDLPVSTITLNKALGVASMLLAIYLINKG